MDEKTLAIIDSNLAKMQQMGASKEEMRLYFDSEIGQKSGVLESIGKSPLGQSIGGSIDKTTNILQNVPNMNPAAAGVQIMGQGAEMVAKPIAAGIGAAYGALPEQIRKPVNQFAGDVAQSVGSKYQSAIDALSNTDAGRAIGDYGMNSPYLQANMQELSDTAKAAGTIAATLPAGKVATQTVKPVARVAGGALEDAGEALIKSADKSADAAKTEFATKLYMPKETPTAVAKMARDIDVSGINQTQKYAPDAYKADAINALKGLPVKPTNTLQKNYNIVQDAVSKEAKALSDALSQAPVKYKATYLNQKIDDGFKSLIKDPLVVGDAETVASRVMQKAKEIAANNPKTPEGLLKSRQQFDSWATSKKGSVFDANDTAFSTAVKSTRNIMNDTLSQIAPNAFVKDSLKKQSLYLDAMDNMATKLSSAPKTRISLMANELLPDHIRLRLLGTGAVIGAGALTSTLPVIGTAAGVAGSLYGLGKAVKSPLLRKTIGTAVRAGGQAIKP